MATLLQNLKPKILQDASTGLHAGLPKPSVLNTGFRLNMRRSHFVNLVIALLLACVSMTSFANNAAQPKQLKKKADRNYASFGMAHNEFKGIDFKLVLSDSINEREQEETVLLGFPGTGAHTYTSTITYGWYLTDSFMTEWRASTGIRSDTIEDSMRINFKYIFNWYIGAKEPITDYMSAYILTGLSHYELDITRYQTLRFRPSDQTTPSTEELFEPARFEMEEGLFGTRFSISWMVGLDYKFNEEWYWQFEYGRLLKDTDTNIEVHQFSTHLRYEF